MLQYFVFGCLGGNSLIHLCVHLIEIVHAPCSIWFVVTVDDYCRDVSAMQSARVHLNVILSSIAAINSVWNSCVSNLYASNSTDFGWRIVRVIEIWRVLPLAYYCVLIVVGHEHQVALLNWPMNWSASNGERASHFLSDPL